MKYDTFTTEELVADEFFQQWVLQPNKSNTAFWENWVQQHPEKQETVREAQEIVLLLGYRDKKLPRERVAQLRHTIFRQLDRPPKHRSFGYWARIAAGVAGLALTLGALVWLTHTFNTVTYATEYGEVREVLLPDSSVISLNANSILSYRDFWSDSGAREVWIEGEAFFKISQMDTLRLEEALKRYRSFVVHTDELDIVVLGTQFNVYTRRKKTSVTLTSGKIAIELHEAEEKTVTLLPGDWVSYDQTSHQFTKGTVALDAYVAGQFDKLTFDQIPLKEVAQIVEDYYGIRIQFENQQLAEQEFVGSVPSDNVEALITAIAELYDLTVVREGNVILFKE